MTKSSSIAKPLTSPKPKASASKKTKVQADETVPAVVASPDPMVENTHPAEVAELLPLGELDRLAIAAETDKSSKRHDYMRFYEHLLTPYKEKSFSMLELGVGLPSRRAPSLRTWKSFFPKARIVGVDIKGISKSFEEDRIHIEIGDAAKPRFLKRVFRTYQPSVILDDASHFWSHQIIGFQTLFPMLPPGGVYIVEDVHTSFLAQEDGAQYADHEESFWSYFSRLQAALVCAQRHGPELSPQESRLVAWIDSISISRRTVAIVKRQKMRRREVVQADTEPKT
ncbi:hypothetical protein [Pseudophaeobacter arcticus]|uniref:hypothetical protein n=1 Tax=Pseudophaeobacter arcticus TaxID=385492 RepID=UPI003A9847BB